MAIETLAIESKEIKKVLKFIGLLTKYMTFDSEMESNNWTISRKKMDWVYSFLPKQKGVVFKDFEVKDVKLRMATSGEPADNQIIMYIHGGGFVCGSAFANKSYISTLASLTGFRVFSPDYSLAPENKFPRAFEECCRVFEYILNTYPKSKISLVGESAGGNLCLSLAHMYKYTGRIANISVHSATVDFSDYVDRSINEKKDIIVKEGSAKPITRMYVGYEKVENPFISPILGDFRGFPPVFITCDANENLYADSQALYTKCDEVGVKTDMIVVSGGFHAFGITGLSTPESAKILKKNIEFIKIN